MALNSANGLCTDGQSIYICETGTNEVKQYSPSTGAVTLVAGGAQNTLGQLDGLGSQASFFDPAGCAWDPVRKVLYVSCSAAKLRARRESSGEALRSAIVSASRRRGGRFSSKSSRQIPSSTKFAPFSHGRRGHPKNAASGKLFQARTPNLCAGSGG